MKVSIVDDSCMAFTVQPEGAYFPDYDCEVEDETAKRWLKISADYWAMQDEIRAFRKGLK